MSSNLDTKLITKSFSLPTTLMMSKACWLFALTAHRDDTFLMARTVS
jgi:hypothetical protein